jgi:hypothetical protein
MRGAIVLGALVACGGHGGNRSIDASATGDASSDAAVDANRPPDGPPLPGGERLADVVVAAPGASGTGNGNPQLAVDGIQGAGSDAGGTDVYSMGYGSNNYITLAWSAGALANGSGADFVVFENPFDEPGGNVFMDLIIVDVSRDGTTWRTMPHQYTSPNETVYTADPSLWVGFAGKTPVLLNDSSNPVDPFDQAAAGGDEFDLDDVTGSDAESEAIRTNGVSYVRLTTAPSQINPDTGSDYVRDSLSNGADIDGMYGRYVGM